MNEVLKKIYELHHLERKEGFSALIEERGNLLKDIVGQGKEVLDIGCRDGALTSYFCQNNKVLGIDIDEEALNRARQKLGLETMMMDLNDDWQELGGRKFDVIVAGEILEHLYYPEGAIKKVTKHLKEKGIFTGSVPNAFSLKNRLRYLVGKKKGTTLEDPTHINHFSYRELKNMLSRYFNKLEIIGLGRFKLLAKLMPNWFAFLLFFKGEYGK